jgi:hypothetical protein
MPKYQRSLIRACEEEPRQKDAGDGEEIEEVREQESTKHQKGTRRPKIRMRLLNMQLAFALISLVAEEYRRHEEWGSWSRPFEALRQSSARFEPTCFGKHIFRDWSEDINTSLSSSINRKQVCF